MSALNMLTQKVENIKNAMAIVQARAEEVARMKNTTAICATYSGGKVEVEGVSYPCARASRDIILQDGCMVYVLPAGKSGYVIVGGGVS